MTKVDLTLIKRLVDELEKSLNVAESLKTDFRSDQVEYLVELGKALGLASSISQEGIYLAGDISKLSKDSYKQAATDSVWDLLSPISKKAKVES